MIKPKQTALIGKPKINPSRKPSLPIKRQPSVVSSSSCLSDRVVCTINPDAFGHYPNNYYFCQRNNVEKYLHKNGGSFSYSSVEGHNAHKKSNLAVRSENIISEQVVRAKNSGRVQERDKNKEKIVTDRDRNIGCKYPSKQRLTKPNCIINSSKNNSAKKSQEHQLTTFQWLIIMRHFFHLQKKKRVTKYIKQRSLMNYIRNKMYPNSLYNEILVTENQMKFTPEQVAKTLQLQGKSKINLDSIFMMLGKLLKAKQNTALSQEQKEDSAAETARFMEQKQSKSMNVQDNSQQEMLGRPTYQRMKKQFKLSDSNTCLAVEPPKGSQITDKSINDKLVEKVNALVINDVSLQSSIENNSMATISPVSLIAQQNCQNISFSIQQSSQFQSLSQTPLSQSVNDSEIFEYALNSIELLKKHLLASTNTSAQKKHIVGFVNEILTYSIYKHQNREESHRDALFYGLKLESSQNTAKISSTVLKRLFNSSQFVEYFRCFEAVKIINHSSEISLFSSLFGSNLRILNLSHNTIRTVSILKDPNLITFSRNLQFINLNFNQLTNISELFTFPNLQQLHVKNNLIDHVSTDTERVMAKKLQIIDLSYNRIEKEEDLWSLRHLPSLTILNLAGNEIMSANEQMTEIRENRWLGLLDKSVIAEYPELYIFSSYTQYKDIAFEARKAVRRNQPK